MYLMMQQDHPDDYVIATGRTTTIRDFARRAFGEVGIDLDFTGTGKDEKGVVAGIDKHRFGEMLGMAPENINHGQTVIQIDPFYYRPTEVNLLIGDASKARDTLGWAPKYTLEEMITEMIENDIDLLKRNHHLMKNGFVVHNELEDII